MPNCFWTSLAFFNEEILSKPRTFFEYEFNDELEVNFTEARDLNQGFQKFDVIFYEGTHVLYPDHAGGEGYEVKIPFHSTVYLGEGLVFQKENSSDDVFSLTTLKSSFEGYEKAFKEQSSGPLTKCVFRLNQ